jgi:hypothetical protein
MYKKGLGEGIDPPDYTHKQQLNCVEIMLPKIKILHTQNGRTTTQLVGSFAPHSLYSGCITMDG